MKRGYLFEIVDLDTKAQAIEARAHPKDQRALDGKKEELARGLQENVITLWAPESLYDIEGLTRSSRYCVARIWSRDEKGEKSQLGLRGLGRAAAQHQDQEGGSSCRSSSTGTAEGAHSHQGERPSVAAAAASAAPEIGPLVDKPQGRW